MPSRVKKILYLLQVAEESEIPSSVQRLRCPHCYAEFRSCTRRESSLGPGVFLVELLFGCSTKCRVRGPHRTDSRGVAFYTMLNCLDEYEPAPREASLEGLKREVLSIFRVCRGKHHPVVEES